MKIINGGVTAAKGFKAAGVHAGVKEGSSPDKNDLALILCDSEATAAGVYTMNRVKAAPIYVTMEHLENGVARGIIANSGNANACAPMGHENAVRMTKAAAAAAGLREKDFIVCSTGVIGVPLNLIFALLILGSPLWFPLLLAAFAVLASVYIVLWAVIVSLYAVLFALAATGLMLLVYGLVQTDVPVLLFSAAVLLQAPRKIAPRLHHPRAHDLAGDLGGLSLSLFFGALMLLLL